MVARRSGWAVALLTLGLVGHLVSTASEASAVSETPVPAMTETPTPTSAPTPTAPAGREALAVTWAPPPRHALFDYQIGGDYEPPEGVRVVSRDWFGGTAPEDLYAICYVNAFQTQDDEAGVDRPDERSNWPPALVLDELGDDPKWGGEYLIDVSTPEQRVEAAAWIEPMIHTCRDKGFEAVEFDNLDSWTRFGGTPVADRVPFGRREAVAYAELLVDLAHGHGLAAAQKNTVQLPGAVSRGRIGFDFAIAEECGRWDECEAYRRVYGDDVIVIEYRVRDLRETCRTVGGRVSVVLRDVLVTTPDSPTYRYARCPRPADRPVADGAVVNPDGRVPQFEEIIDAVGRWNVRPSQGGVYLDRSRQGIPVFLVVGDLEAGADELQAMIGRDLTFGVRRAERSMAELEAIKQAVLDTIAALDEAGVTLVSVGPDIIRNRVDVGVMGPLRRAREILEEHGSAIRVYRERPGVLD